MPRQRTLRWAAKTTLGCKDKSLLSLLLSVQQRLLHRRQSDGNNLICRQLCAIA